MKREFSAIGMVALAGWLAAGSQVRADDLVTLSGRTYRDVRPVRVEPDGVTWQYDGGAVKVDFADCPETLCRAYHYDPAKATEYRDAQLKMRQQADEQALRDARLHEARQRARAQVALAQLEAGQGEASTVFRRGLSPAASAATREMAEQMRAATEQRAAAAAASGDPLKLVPTLPGVLGPRPINPTMNTPDAKEFAASLHHSPTGATSNFVPTSLDSTRSNLHDDFFEPLYSTRSYFEDTDRAAAFARGVPLKP